MICCFQARRLFPSSLKLHETFIVLFSSETVKIIHTDFFGSLICAVCLYPDAAVLARSMTAGFK